jgi:hypothetical protein
MSKRILMLALLALTATAFAANVPARPLVVLQTSLGEIVV